MRAITQEDLTKVAVKERARGQRRGRIDALLIVEAALGEEAADKVEDYVDAHGWVLEESDRPARTMGG